MVSGATCATDILASSIVWPGGVTPWLFALARNCASGQPTNILLSGCPLAGWQHPVSARQWGESPMIPDETDGAARDAGWLAWLGCLLGRGDNLCRQRAIVLT